MEILKLNETYQISDKNEKGWELTGTVSKDINNSLWINFSVTKPGELIENIGDCSYSRPSYNSETISVSYNVSEVKRAEFVPYMDSVIDSVLQHFNQAS